MRAAFVLPEPNGGRLEIREVETPKTASGPVLVRVKASGLNRGEVLYRRAALKGEPLCRRGRIRRRSCRARRRRRRPQRRSARDGAWRGDTGRLCRGRAARADADTGQFGWAEAAAFPNVFITAHDAMVTAGGFRPGESI